MPDPTLGLPWRPFDMEVPRDETRILVWLGKAAKPMAALVFFRALDGWFEQTASLDQPTFHMIDGIEAEATFYFPISSPTGERLLGPSPWE